MVARELADGVGLPLLEKDGIKELLFDTLGARDRTWSRTVGAAAFALLFDGARRILSAGSSCVFEANFAGDIAERELMQLPTGRFLQLYVAATPELLVARFRARASSDARHTGHADVAALPEVEKGLVEGRWRPLELPDDGSISTRRSLSTSGSSFRSCAPSSATDNGP